MQILNINDFQCRNICFKSSIIDSHVHTGKFLGKKYDYDDIDVFIKSPLNVKVQQREQTDNVEKMLVSNLDSIGTFDVSDEIKGNEDMLKLCQKSDKLYPIAVCNPCKTNGSAKNIVKLLKKHPSDFVGLKFHPEANNLKANDLKYDEYLDVAFDFKLPCIFHSQVNVNWQPDDNDIWFPTVVENKNEWSNSDPEFIYELAKRHPDVPIIMAHTGAGGALAHDKAINVLLQSIDKGDASLYCDISWLDFENGLPDENSKSLVKLINELKERDALDRILFGTDAPLGCYGEKIEQNIPPKKAYESTVSAFKTVIKNNFPEDSEKIIQKIFYDNAYELFFIS